MQALGAFVGKSPQGIWTLEVEDKDKQDTGTLRKFSIEMSF
jgi:subtilisin-like proprotein convertase family protein